MKWFKHDTDCDKSEGLVDMIHKFGWAYYGRWFRLLEIVASKMDETDKCHAEFPIKEWCKLLSISKKLFIGWCMDNDKLRKTKTIINGDLMRIEIPNLLKKRDNHTKNLQATCKKLVSNLPLDVDVDVDVDVTSSSVGTLKVVDVLLSTEGQAKGNDFSKQQQREKDAYDLKDMHQLIEQIVEVTNDGASTSFWQLAIKKLGVPCIESELGALKYQMHKTKIENPAAYLTQMLQSKMREQEGNVATRHPRT